MRAFAVVCLLSGSLGSWAPLQCSSDPDPDVRRYETPGEALYGLAGQLKARGNRDGWRDTLRYLIDHYPNSRFAERAKQDLADASGSSPP
jgi:hypothetical protein